MVAIPFSSGLCSFSMIVFSFRKDRGRNPFFIRSVFVRAGEEVPLHYTVAIPFSSGLCSFRQARGLVSALSRNPFFIRSVFVPLTGP